MRSSCLTGPREANAARLEPGTRELREYGALAVGHEGSSSVTTCCAVIRVVALPEEGVVISVQANTPPRPRPYELYNSEVVRLTQVLRDTAQR